VVVLNSFLNSNPAFYISNMDLLVIIFKKNCLLAMDFPLGVPRACVKLLGLVGLMCVGLSPWVGGK
jgi:hypothetical protein